ncbi:glycosyltransferase family 2 protein [Algoriphagus litoralis]|uniref:glycosyltransferase family 2 protein n=1 Tax=Algoriphagus litoralis TaxID=2202829 RepID=UPI0013009561|nr:glycosyltransferase family 2 protein [Algoriphagus litoralis]
MTTTLSVVLPNFNGRDLLESYLPYTFKALENSGCIYEFLLVDDCSTDDTIEFISHHYPQIRILKNEENRGFSYSCNRGIFESVNELVFLLNSDIKLSPEYFSGLFTYFSNPDTFGVMGKILSRDGSKLEIGAKIPRRIGKYVKTDFQYLPNSGSNSAPTLFLSGANALLDRKKLIELGGFDELFSPFYSEDLDLGIRAWRMGWKCYFHEQSYCYHLGSATMKTQVQKEWVKTIYFRNRMLFHAIHLDVEELRWWRAQAIFMDVLPKLLIGKTWIWNSFKALKALEGGISQSRNKLLLQLQKKQGSRSLSQVVREFDRLMKSQQIVWKS